MGTRNESHPTKPLRRLHEVAEFSSKVEKQTQDSCRSEHPLIAKWVVFQAFEGAQEHHATESGAGLINARATAFQLLEAHRHLPRLGATIGTVPYRG